MSAVQLTKGSMDFDDLLKLLGEFGRYQKYICSILLLCLVVTPFNNVGIVFIAGVPEHWCFTPELHWLNLSDNVIKNLTIPLESATDTAEVTFSRCLRYKRNYTGWTEDDVWQDLTTARNRTEDPVEMCHDGWTYDRSIYRSTVATEVM